MFGRFGEARRRISQSAAMECPAMVPANWRRTVTVNMRPLGSDSILLHAHLAGPGHLLDVQLVVRGETGEVTSAYATAGQEPLGEACRQAMRQVEETLVGRRLPLQRDDELAACPYLVTLIEEAGRILDGIRAGATRCPAITRGIHDSSVKR